MFRKILIIFSILILISTSCFGAAHFVSSVDGDDTDDGHSMDDGTGGGVGAWATLEHALEAGSLTAGDTVFVRRTHSESVSASNISISYDGTAIAPITIMGWPRAAHSVASSDWVNGDATVVIDDADADREQHLGRWITGPDGFDYLITIITNASSIEINRPYAGATADNEAVSIKADEDWTADMGTAYGFDDSGWTIKETTYDADADDLPLFDFNETDNFGLNSSEFVNFKNLDILDLGTSGFNIKDTYTTLLQGMLFRQNANKPIIVTQYGSYVIINRCIFVGSGAGTSQVGISQGRDGFYILNSAIYNMGDSGILTQAPIYIFNTNIGKELANGDEDILSQHPGDIIGRDVMLGATNGDIQFGASYHPILTKVTIVNYQNILGDFKTWFYGGTYKKVAVTGVTPNKKLSDNVIEITPITAATYKLKEIEQKVKVWESRKTYDAGTYNVKVWIFNDDQTNPGNLNDTTASDDILMRCRAEAANYGDATTEYVSMPWIYSDEIDIEDNADADDWDYLQCDSVVVDLTGSRIYCEILVSTYDAESDAIYIDPETSNP